MSMDTNMSGSELEELLRTLEEAAEFKTFNRKAFFQAYPKQQDFFDLGSAKRERLLMAGNQLGKSEAGAFECACHLTGEYPDWWLGRKFPRPVKGWAAGETSLVVRDVQQKKLCGEPGVDSSFGTGYIPKSCFIDKPSLARGVTDAYDTIQVQHKTNGIEDGVSILRFKSYEQGRQKMQGETLDFFWGDEEPPADIYSEMLTRITATRDGLGYITFTPLKGMSEVVLRYLNEKSPDRAVTTMTIEDALHIPAEERAKIIAGYPAHEREARARGVPMLGSGRIFQVSEENISEPIIDNVPLHWAKLWGIDFGIGHPFAAVLIAWDKDNDVIHVLHAVRMSDLLPINHAAAMKPIAASVPVAWPQDGTERRDDGLPLSNQYKTQGLIILPTHATHADGSVSTEAGIIEMQNRMMTGRFKVAAHLSQWFEEFRLYHRKDGMIVKLHDDIMSATRVAVMMRRFARPVALGGMRTKRKGSGIAQGVDFNPF